ncbi:MAG: glycerophosphodiester phosphodiesterase [Lentimonas sp.]
MHKPFMLGAMLSLSLVGVFAAESVQAVDLHVSPAGSDAFVGTTKKQSVASLAKARDLTRPYSSKDAVTVHVADGVSGNDPFSDIASGGTITTLDAVPAVDSSRFFALEEKQAQVLVIAHRGDSINAPENTVASITSIAGAADLTEMDGQVTSDGVLVLMHDDTVDRTTDGTGPVVSMTLAQLQTLDAGSWYSAAFAGEQVPTLAAAINAAIANGIEPLIERKKGDASVYHAEFAAQTLSPNDFRVISFDAAFLNALDALNPDYRLGWLGSDPITQEVIDQAKANGADFLSWKETRVNQAVVDLVDANGLELMVWTVNDPLRMQELIDLGVRAITTDNPALLRSLLP